MPFNGVRVIVPLLTPGHEVPVDEILDVIPPPVNTKTVLVPVQPAKSVIVTVCDPGVRPVNTPVGCDAPPSIEKV